MEENACMEQYWRRDYSVRKRAFSAYFFKDNRTLLLKPTFAGGLFTGNGVELSFKTTPGFLSASRHEK